MKGSALVAASLLILLLLVVPHSTVSARHISRPSSNHGHRHSTRPKAKVEHVANPNFYWERRLSMRPGRADTVRIAGSSLPDCSHACGSCSPCRLVMVSFVCASVQEAETCPMAYKCMCNKKSYPVP
ncbi:protein EPIDERMAL PATTERNING FACTOR 1 isoform X2 [Rhodamnia argentea]|uniref:Epidermal patterning factor-like protein n=1 Tax=Rhodamnia argentea TaxID=178133 RepID=A0A8B8MXG2_9MYRT|nr:protein EPIDERMAL PATTERNING FACTOR 1 isoform X2 [Rhodamnia argentea]